VDATYDQVYRGYNFELRASKVAEAVEATRGQVVAYQNVPVITPYFSHSDGRTRSWEEVWAGDPKPWLVSVPDPACAGMDLFGHGVGMSALGAIAMANDGQTAADILSYYYQGTGLVTLY
jgi:peptidoglycan hydrolase-like amidase